eukprot:c22836_g1_i1 orf=539-1156(+)
MNLFESGGTTPIIRSAEQRRVQDLDLRLGHAKNSTLPSTRSNRQTVTIVVEDDDDDVQISSPRSVAQVKTSSSSRHHRITDLGDEDLELRLGLAGTEGSGVRKRSGDCCTAIDLTSTVYSDHEVLPRTIDKRKHAIPTSESAKELKLTCAICMDTVKEEMSTICGHIFCRVCIMGAFQVQKKCPTCRRKLTNSQIHRIYLPCSTG